MADVKGGVNPLFLREEELRQGMELLFFAYRDFTAEPDKILARYNFGRAHHRVIYFVGRHPSITVSELLSILGITKQSLSRVLGQLVREGFVVQRPGQRDRRQRLLELTEKGRELERLLSENQRRRMARAYRAAGAEAVEGFRTVLRNLIEERDWARFEAAEPAPAALRRQGSGA
jgi:DNA-binding MarR family transcriptional regulator